MAKCIICGKSFNVGNARRLIGRRYGAGLYNEIYPDGNVCEECADEEIGTGLVAGEEVIELMGTGWDWDDD